jgi:S-DNA-T family DNA segregation ATPase FtsK/SpoIIIE
VKLKFTVVGGRREDRDVVVTADVTATIGHIAARLAAVETDGGVTGPLTLRVEYPGARQARILNRGAQVQESSLRSGCRVEVVAVGERRRGDERDDTPAALVKVVAGPESGREYRLQRGVNLIGRDTSAAVFLGDDAEVSRRHATITVGDNVSVADLNSANGVHLDGMLVQRAIVTGSSRIRVGTSVLQAVALPGAGAGDDTSLPAAFSRSPGWKPPIAVPRSRCPRSPSPSRLRGCRSSYC